MTSHNNRKVSRLAGLIAGLIMLGGRIFQAGTGLAAAERAPELIFSTYLGGSGGEAGVAMGRDHMGRLHLTGTTWSEDFPRVNTQRWFYPFFQTDVFLATFAGNRLVYSSFLNFPGEVSPFDLAIYGPHVYFIGTGRDTDFWVGFARRSTIWYGWEKDVQQRFLPFFEIPPNEYVYSLGAAAATDREANLYVAGTARYFDQEHSFHKDLVVAKLTPELETVWVRAVVDGIPELQTLEIAVDDAGNAYVAGNTNFALPATAGAFQSSPGGDWDGFVLKLGPSGSVEYLTHLGGSNWDLITDIDVGSDGSAVVVGETFSADFPVRAALQPFPGGHDAFVAKLTPDGSGLEFSTYLGGSRWDGISAVSLASGGSLFVAGTTGSADYPQVKAVPRPCAPVPQLCGRSDAFVTELAPDGSAIVFSTFLGGSGSDSAADLVVSRQYEVALTGTTGSRDLPLVEPVQAALAGSTDVFLAVLKVSNEPPDCASAQVSPAVIWPPDGKLVPVSIAVPDPDGDPVTVRVYSVTQDEPLSGTAPDAIGIGTPTAWVRADREGGGDGRVYRLGFEGRDEFGAFCTGALTVCVPHDRRPGAACGAGWGWYDSSGSGG
jgi:hypothetical protein